MPPKADIASLRFGGWNSPTAVTERAEYGFRTVDRATRKLVGLTYWQASENLPNELLAMLPSHLVWLPRRDAPLCRSPRFGVIHPGSDAPRAGVPPTHLSVRLVGVGRDACLPIVSGSAGRVRKPSISDVSAARDRGLGDSATPLRPGRLPAVSDGERSAPAHRREQAWVDSCVPCSWTPPAGRDCGSCWSLLLTRPRREAGPLQSGRLLRQCIGMLRVAATRPARSKPEAGALAAPAVG
jgi:hypothetical protein